MLKTIITPQNTHVQLAIPEEYVGKQLEILVFKSEEVESNKSKHNSPGQWKGKLKLTENQHQDFHHHINTLREEWNRPA